MRFQLLLSSAFVATLITSCEPEKPTPPPTDTQLDFSCIQTFGVNGSVNELYGGCTSTNDWNNITLTPEEVAYLNILGDTVSVVGANATDVSGFAFFPNPVVIDKAAYFSVRGSNDQQRVKIRLAVIDEDKKILDQYSLATEVNKIHAFLVAPEKYKVGSYYRCYYRISTESNDKLYEGYGNFLVCTTYIEPGVSTVEGDCL